MASVYRYHIGTLKCSLSVTTTVSFYRFLRSRNFRREGDKFICLAPCSYRFDKDTIAEFKTDSEIVEQVIQLVHSAIYSYFAISY